MWLTGGLLALQLAGAAPADMIEHVRVVCEVETDAVCPERAPDALGPNWGQGAVFLRTFDTSRSTPGADPSTELPAADLALRRRLNPAWQLQEVVDRPELGPCAGPLAAVRWDPARVDLAWLKVRLWQIPSLQPQRCAMAPGVCLTDC